ncbi:hypothetical protein SAY87_027095 [Trapa incisa]|uniref:Uncharacterized protein n=1 Tax=Trapa incisa TaxID=236973 RepID=A0AAN7JEM2_9MYRT|nr:hypothetical protein SAY87_027095 [Trapa incisa]
MVSRVEEAVKKIREQQQQQKLQIDTLTLCNKGKAPKFKRSYSNLQDDGASSAILLLLCIACNSTL